jgi:hypothetical protein
MAYGNHGLAFLQPPQHDSSDGRPHPNRSSGRAASPCLYQASASELQFVFSSPNSEFGSTKSFLQGHRLAFCGLKALARDHARFGQGAITAQLALSELELTLDAVAFGPGSAKARLGGAHTGVQFGTRAHVKQRRITRLKHCYDLA